MDDKQDLFRFIEKDEIASEKITAPRYSYWRSVFRVFFRKKINIVCLVIFALVLLASYVLPIFWQYDPFENVSTAATYNLNPIEAFDKVCMAHISWARVAGKPFVASEWSFSGPAFHRGVAGLYGGALAGMQDWGGVWRFAYGHSLNEVSGPAGVPGYFNTADDPVMTASDRVFACLFLRGDVPVAVPRVNLTVDERALLTDGPKKGDWETMASSPRNQDVVLLARVSCGMEDVADARNFLLADWGVRFGSPTNALPVGEVAKSPCVRYDRERRHFAVRTDRTCGIFAPAGASLKAGALSVSLEKTEATVAAMSLDGKPLVKSSRILLSHLTDAHGAGCAFRDEACTVLVSYGKPPVLVRDGTAKVSLALESPSRFKVYALGLDGRRRFELPAHASNASFSFTASVRGEDGRAVMEYEVVEEAL